MYCFKVWIWVRSRRVVFFAAFGVAGCVELAGFCQKGEWVLGLLGLVVVTCLLLCWWISWSNAV